MAGENEPKFGSEYVDKFGLLLKDYQLFGVRNGSASVWLPGTDLTRNGPTQFDHRIPLGMADVNPLLRDLYQFSDTFGRPLFDPYQMEIIGRQLPSGTNPELAGTNFGAYTGHPNGFNHPAWFRTLNAPGWFGTSTTSGITKDWLDAKAAILQNNPDASQENFGTPPFFLRPLRQLSVPVDTGSRRLGQAQRDPTHPSDAGNVGSRADATRRIAP